jgi:predicted phosphodiesterase
VSTLVDDLLALPTAPALPARSAKASDFSRELVVKGDTAETTINTAAADRPELEGHARNLLEEYDLDPADWVVTGFRSSKWTMANGEEGVSARFSFGRRGTSAAPPERGDIADLIAAIELHQASPITVRQTGDHAFIVALGDMQFGKVDGDGIEGTLARTIQYLNDAADVLAFYRKRFDIGHVHIAWLGDHIEGFVSQGGANTWRTRLTLNEQIRLTRKVMLHAVQVFGPLAERVTVVAVPGNHGDPQRFMGKGVTRYDDSHDTEALIAVSEAVALDPARYGHVEFYVPDTDEMSVVLDLAGTVTGHVHGHQFRPGQHFKWWGEQSFGESQLAHAKLLLVGHLHHELIEGNGKRLILQVPALEAESTWYRHSRGVNGNPGIVVAVTKGGHTSPIEVIR